MDLQAVAIRLQRYGLTPVPIRVEAQRDGRTVKRPLIAWGALQHRAPTAEEVAGWPWERANGVAFLPKGARVVLDIDDPYWAESFLRYLERLGQKTRLHRTRRGIHAYLRDRAGLAQTVPIYACGKPVGELIAGQAHLVTYFSPYHTPLAQHPAWGPVALEVDDAKEFVKNWLASSGAQPTIGDGARPTTGDGAIPEGRRNVGLTRLAGAMRRYGMAPAAIEAALLAENAARCVPPLPDAEVKSIARSVSRYEPAMAAGPVLVSIGDVQREAVQWLWAGRLPLGKITILEGDPGVGKSWLTLAVAAAISRGAPLPGQEDCPPASVLVLTAEDGLADTVRPRLEDMGADLGRVKALVAVRDPKGKTSHFSLVDDLEHLEGALQGGGYGLVIIDPLNAYLGTTLDTHRDAALRSVLTPLAALAERYRVAVIAVRHLTKTPRDRAIYRGQGSIAYTAAARVVHLVGFDPGDPSKQRRVMATVKNNLAAPPLGLAFEIAPGGRLDQAAFRWLGETDVTPAALLAPEKDSALDEAVTTLREALAAGPVKVTDLRKEAQELGISWRTFENAKRALKAEAFRLGEKGHRGRGSWYWRMPGETRAAGPVHPETVALF